MPIATGFKGEIMKKIESLIDWIGEVVKSKKVIIVEGPYDKKALENIGVTNKIVVINDGKGLFETVEKIVGIVNAFQENSGKNAGKKEIIILTDFDKKGKELYEKMKKDLIREGIKIDTEFKEWLRRRTKICHIEGLDTYVEHDGYVRN